MRRLPRVCLVGLLAWSCRCGPDDAVNMTPESLSGNEANSSAALTADGSRLFFDASAGHLLEGSLLPAPEDADPAPVSSLLLDGKPTGRLVLDARFVPWEPSTLLVIDAQGRLSLGEADPPVVLAKDVQPGFDLSPACRCAVFVRGEADQGVLMRLGLDDRKVTILSDDVSPVWLPAVSPDGSEVAFVSGRDGEAAIWRMPLSGGAPRRWTDAGQPFPEGPDRMLFTESGLLFAQAGVVHHLDERGHVTSRAGLAAPRWAERPRIVSFGQGRPMGVKEAITEVRR